MWIRIIFWDMVLKIEMRIMHTDDIFLFSIRTNIIDLCKMKCFVKKSRLMYLVSSRMSSLYVIAHLFCLQNQLILYVFTKPRLQSELIKN